ncbi:MAG TPA: FliM/FliN family flagellar motor switch protein [Bryobacteraceae bacterium]|jgi:flagellar motor switch protein FliM
MRRELSQQEIDAVFQGGDSSSQGKQAAVPFDFSRLDRIPKSQIRAVHLLHENFSRNLAATLSAYLRAYVSMNLVSLEQISYAEFLEGLASPTFIAYVGLRPYDGTAVMELSPALVFAFVEMLLGGGSKPAVSMQRKVTEIEKQLMHSLLRVILQDLSEAWKGVTDIRFAVQSLADEPQVLHVLSPAEAVVAIAIEVRVGQTTGMINLAIPSIFIKRLRHMFERLRRVHRAESKKQDQLHMAHLLAGVNMEMEIRLDGSTILTRDLLDLRTGDVLMLNHPLTKEAVGLVNGSPKFRGDVSVTGGTSGFRVASGFQEE